MTILAQSLICQDGYNIGEVGTSAANAGIQWHVHRTTVFSGFPHLANNTQLMQQAMQRRLGKLGDDRIDESEKLLAEIKDLMSKTSTDLVRLEAAVVEWASWTRSSETTRRRGFFIANLPDSRLSTINS